MNIIWTFLIIISIVFGFINGTTNEVVNAFLNSLQTSIKVAFSLIGIMAFWLGIMNIAKKSGLIETFSKLISPLIRLIFKEIPKDNEATTSIALNFTANALGLSNAATPFGIKAMEDMQKLNPEKEKATNSMCTFLGMNTAGFQLIPTSTLAILTAAGATNPTEIIVPAIITTTIAFIGAIILSKIFERMFKW